MILVLGGTTEGREITSLLLREGHPVMVSVTEGYAGELLPAGAPRLQGKLDNRELAALIERRKINLLIDATHPFAAQASQNALAACRSRGIEYIRFERPSTPLPDSELIHRTADFQEAVRTAFSLGKRIFLTTGTRHLAEFAAAARETGGEIFAKTHPFSALSDPSLKLVPPSHIIAVQGPHSQAFNRALFREYRADVIVTKESGPQGGTAEKLGAALELSIPAVVVQRPALAYPRRCESYHELLTNLISL